MIGRLIQNNPFVLKEVDYFFMKKNLYQILMKKLY